MNVKLVEDIAAAVLYEGYLLYPYRASAIKNQQRWNFGVLYPRAYAAAQTGADTWWNQTECLLRADAETRLTIRIRFLHLLETEGNAQIARERDIAFSDRLGNLAATVRATFSFSAADRQQALEAALEVSAESTGAGLTRLRLRILNNSQCGDSRRQAALGKSLVSTHSILSIDRGEFVSLLEPSEDAREAAAACNNIATWPVLAGDDGSRDAMLSSPIILYDYPKIAPESPGALFDGTEIDEILTLRIMTLTDEEKREMGLTDQRAREILERTESMPPEQFMKLHGVLRGLRDVEEAP